MKIGLGSDPFGIELKEAVKQHLLALGHECVDIGGTADAERPYFEVTHELAGKVGSGECERGVLVCRTGMGMAIIANKHTHVYAAVCEDPSAAAKARSINNAIIITLGGMVTAAFKAKEIVDAFLNTGFKSGWDEEAAGVEPVMVHINCSYFNIIRVR
ncbi:MAG: RpiB/LacA/LacB family sugar-phosphate isomerase [Desulfobacterales bacterium]